MATMPLAGRRYHDDPGRPWRLGRPAGPRAPGLVERLPGTVAAIMGGAALGCGLVLAVRRLAGGFPPTDPATAWLAAAAGLAVVAIVDLVAASSRRQPVTMAVAGPWFARCGLACGVAAIAFQPPPAGWSSLAAVATAALPLVIPPRAAGNRRSPQNPRQPQRVARFPDRRDRAARGPTGTPIRRRRAPLPGKLVQRQARYASSSGGDFLRGRVLLSVAAGGKGAQAHVGFCPAFAQMPHVRVTTDYDGVEAVVSAAEVLPWGVRVECKLSEPADEPLEIPVDVLVEGTA